jgi:ribosomal protein L9
MDADMKIIEVLQGGSHITMNSTYRDPKQEIIHQRWRKEQADIVIDKKQITLKSKIKSEGIFEVDCKLGHGIHGLAKIDVIAE